LKIDSIKVDDAEAKDTSVKVGVATGQMTKSGGHPISRASGLVFADLL